jgi:DNA topoisomerase-6 subunit B
MPAPPKETLPHPYGVDVELLQRLIQITTDKNMLDFLRHHFHRVGEITAQKFLDFAGLSHPRIEAPKPRRNCQVDAEHEEVKISCRDASCQPLGEELLSGHHEGAEPEYLVVHQRKPSTCAGHRSSSK